MIPNQSRPTLSGDYATDIRSYQQLFDHFPVFPIHVEQIVPNLTIGGTTNDYVITSTALFPTHLKQEPWTDLVVHVDGSMFPGAASSRASWHPTLTSELAVTYTAATRPHFFNFNSPIAHWGVSGTALFRGLPAGAYSLALVLSVTAGNVQVNVDDTIDVTITEAIPYGQDGTT